jgi:hypothetical protein
MHAIDVYLIRKEDLREEKINQVLDNKTENAFHIKHGQPKFIDLGSGIYATTRIPDSKEWRENKLICHIETDYFGGFGEQSAKLFRGKTILMKGDTRIDPVSNPINEALKMMGVERKSGMDEFDTIGLGRYRTNEDFK